MISTVSQTSDFVTLMVFQRNRNRSQKGVEGFGTLIIVHKVTCALYNTIVTLKANKLVYIARYENKV